VHRRDFLSSLGATLALAPGARQSRAVPTDLVRRAIPSTGELLPVIGMGTWLTFDVGRSEVAQRGRRDVLAAFLAGGGTLVDSSPMYGSSEQVVGILLGSMTPRPATFSATKVWTIGRSLGRSQMEASRRLWGVERFDLMQVHNLLDWDTHLPVLKAMKSEGRLRYIGVTTSHGRRHDELERLMRAEPLDFIQVTLNLADRSVEERILPLARDRGIAVIINRPLDGGDLFARVRRQAFPAARAAEWGCANWAEVFLKFVVSHPAVTAAIPATTRVEHVREDLGAMRGVLPTAAQRDEIARLIARV
jgi:diketogulonate reductase-like aldo/keto reductase